MLALDVGCGKKKPEPGASGLDRPPGSAADVLCELTHFPCPICDNCADRFYLSHFLEYQPDVLRAMAEVHRIAKPGGEVIVVTPHYSSPDSYSDPTHFHHLGYHSFDYFARDAFENFTYAPGGFRIVERQSSFGDNLLLDSLARLCAAISVDFYEKHLAWMLPARKIISKLSVVK